MNDEAAVSPARVYQLPPSEKSYLYVRLSILVVVVALAVSIVLERYVDGVKLGSISAYYYTPVHSLFVGALVALGVVMIALRSSDDLEDMVMNVAGAVAPIVAFVPTAPPTVTGDASLSVAVDADSLIHNNVLSMLAALVVALMVAVVLALRRSEQGAMVPRSRSTIVGLVLSGMLLAMLIGWYMFARDHFLLWAHGASAVVMFALIIVAVFVNANWPAGVIAAVRRWLGIDPVPVSPEHRVYLAIAAWMVLGAAAAVVFGGASRVFWLEAVEISGFFAFWTVQTLAPPPSSPLNVCHHDA